MATSPLCSESAYQHSLESPHRLRLAHNIPSLLNQVSQTINILQLMYRGNCGNLCPPILTDQIKLIIAAGQ